jgi:acyl carrier protein
MYPEIRTLVVEWLDDNYHFGQAEELIGSDERSFLENGILDSLGFVQLIVHLENTYHIKLERKQLTRANFDSLRKIITHVSGHRDYRGPK